jgi:uncharacterized RDD family membrane protein YckC
VYSTDRVDIDTPEQITLELSLAGIGSRFLALALDTLLQGVLYTVVILSFVYLASTSAGESVGASAGKSAASGQWGVAFIILFGFCVYWGYFAAFEVLWHGQTPGKRVAGIRVVKDSGRPITAIEGIGRNVMRAIDGLGLYFVGLICMVISRQNRRLGDYVAGTLVVYDKKSTEVKPDWNMAPSTQAAETVQEVNQLSESDLVIIETYLHRRLDLDPMVRIATAIRICERIQQKSGLTREPGQTDDDFLEAIARRMRDHARFRSGTTI